MRVIQAIIILIILLSGINSSAQIEFSIITNLVKVDHYSYGHFDSNFGFKHEGEAYIPDIDFRLESGRLFGQLGFSNHDGASFKEFAVYEFGDEDWTRLKSFQLSIGYQLLASNSFLMYSFVSVHHLLDSSYIGYYGGRNGFELLFCANEITQGYGGGLALQYNIGKGIFLELESTLTNFSHRETSCFEIIDHSSFNIFSNSLRIGYRF